MLTVVAFVFALALLIAVHEAGHFFAARAFNVKVLRFSIGFGWPVFQWRSPLSGTEFVLALFPLGGYVRMLDEREAPIPAGDRRYAYNNQPLFSKACIVFAGPAANLLLAVALCSVVNWVGIKVPSPVLSAPVAGSVAELAGLRSADRVVGAAIGEGEQHGVVSFEDLTWAISRALLLGQNLTLDIRRSGIETDVKLELPLGVGPFREPSAEMLRDIGITGPYSRPVIGGLTEGGRAQAAGLAVGDQVISVDGRAILDAHDLRQWIRKAGSVGEPKPSTWIVSRDGNQVALVVAPEISHEGQLQIGKVGASIGTPPAMVEQSFGLLEGLSRGFERTWQSSILTLKMIARMILGDASLTNLSGPLTIAEYAGKSATMGWTQYLTFLALISVSLGVLNLLPLPVLDGGHLMYYLWEGVTRRPLSEVALARLQRVGWLLLALITATALLNDIRRLLG